ncbi:MAG: hypothetical protein ACR5K7_05995 [Symbiopectobacterium sp.]
MLGLWAKALFLHVFYWQSLIILIEMLASGLYGVLSLAFSNVFRQGVCHHSRRNSGGTTAVVLLIFLLRMVLTLLCFYGANAVVL